MQKDRFYALLAVIALNSGAYWFLEFFKILK